MLFSLLGNKKYLWFDQAAHERIYPVYRAGTKRHCERIGKRDEKTALFRAGDRKLRFLSGGKRLRPVLTLLWYNLLETEQKITHPELSVYDASVVLEMFHVASLLHDDVLDNAELRRGKTASHVKFGVRPCLLAGDALLAMGNKQMAEFQNTALMSIISDALLKTANGEIEEINLTGKIPDNAEEYLAVIEGKTAWIIRSACEVGAVMAGAAPKDVAAARDFGLNLGMAFQIVDDALDFSPEEIIGKPSGGDLRERKCTPPVHMYLQSLTESERADFIQKFQNISNPVLQGETSRKPKEKHSASRNCKPSRKKSLTRAIRKKPANSPKPIWTKRKNICRAFREHTKPC